MIWFIFWAIMSVFVLGMTFWSFSLLKKQNKALKQYAHKYGMEYYKAGLFKVSSLAGQLKGFTVLIAPETVESARDGAVGVRQVTLIQLQYDGHLTTGCAIGTGYFKEFVAGLGLEILHIFSKHNFDDNGVAVAWNEKAMTEYMSDERLDAFKEVMALPHADALYMSDPENTILQVYTAAPLDTPRQVDVFVKTMMKAAKILSIEPEAELSEPVVEDKAEVLDVPEETVAES